MPRKRKSSVKKDSDSIVSVVDEEVDVESPVEEKESEVVEVDARFKGSGNAVKKAMAQYSVPSEEDDFEEGDSDDGDISTHLLNPNLQVIVKRTFPTHFNGVRCMGELARFDCPVSLEDIREEIFTRHGGNKYRVSVHPSTPNGEHKVLSAFTISHPTGAEPILVSDSDEDEDWQESLDPTMVDSNDAMDVLEQTYERKARVTNKKIKAKEMDNALRELESGEGKDSSVGEVHRLQRQVDDLSRRREFDSKLNELESKLVQQKGNAPDMMMTVLQMMENNNQQQNQLRLDMMNQQNQMYQSMIKQTQNKEEASISSKLNTLMFDLLSDKLFGGKPQEEEDPLKFAVKEILPAAKELMGNVLKKEDVAKGVPMSEGEAQKAYEQAKQEAVAEVTNRLRVEMAQRQQLALQQQAQMQSQGQPKQSSPVLPAGTPTAAANTGVGIQPSQSNESVPHSPTPAGIASPVQAVPQQEVALPREGAPPVPGQEGYDRAVAVNFVLDSLISDIKEGCPDESFVIDDFLEQLDEEILNKFIDVNSADDLHTLIEPYADKEKINYIKARGEENRKIRSWLTRIVTTVQDVYLDQKEGAESVPPAF